MVEHPAARALTGYLLVRGGVHQVAYAREVEHLTSADLMKLFPSPRIPTDKIPESQPHIERGEHTKLYRFSQEDFGEVKAVWNASTRRRVRSSPSRTCRTRPARPHTTSRRGPPSSRPTTRRRRSSRDRPAPAEGRIAQYPTGVVSEESQELVGALTSNVGG
jgi:Mn-containing catalase